MNYIDVDKLKENNKLEIKKSQNKLPDSIWETYSAFANTDGGTIILGLEEKNNHYSPVDIDVDKIKKELWDNLNNKTKVSINLLKDKDVDVAIIDDKSVIVINVPRAGRTAKPVFINADLFNGTYKRNHEGDYHCSKDEINTMLVEASKLSMDSDVVSEIEFEDLSKDTISKYRQRFSNIHPQHLWNELSDKDFLLRIGAAKISDDKYMITEAGLLFFGFDWKIISYYPNYFLDYRYSDDFSYDMRWNERIVTGLGEGGEGNLFDFFFRVTNSIISHINTPFSIGDDGITRNDDTMERKVVREALVNALSNADYHLPRGVKVLFDGKDLLVENPGRFLIDVKTVLIGGNSEPRNKGILRMFNAIGIGDQAGYGIPTINDFVKNKLYKTITIKEDVQPDRSSLLIPLVGANITNDDNFDSYLSNIKKGQKISRKEILKQINISNSTLTYKINKALESGLITRASTNGYYVKQ